MFFNAEWKKSFLVFLIPTVHEGRVTLQTVAYNKYFFKKLIFASKHLRSSRQRLQGHRFCSIRHLAASLRSKPLTLLLKESVRHLVTFSRLKLHRACSNKVSPAMKPCSRSFVTKNRWPRYKEVEALYWYSRCLTFSMIM